MTAAAAPRVLVVSEFYPRAHDPVLGVWAHRQALAARDAGADVAVLVLHRPVPPLDTPRGARLRTARTLLGQPRRAMLDGLPVRYVRFLAPPRPRAYGRWGAWAAPALAAALRAERRRRPFDLVHAHNAVPAGDAVRRARLRGVPLVVSVHGGDVLWTAPRFPDGERAVRATFGAADLVLANSAGIAGRASALGAAAPRVLHLGTDLPDPGDPAGPARGAAAPRDRPPLLVSLGHLVARKRHADVLEALALLEDRRVRWLVIGDGPERERLRARAAGLGLAGRVELAGQLPHEEALRRAREADVLVLPSEDEAFGVAYVEAMAAGLPAVGARGEPGPEEIAAAGDGLVLVPPRDPLALAAALRPLLADPARRAELGRAARATVERAFTWERCGRETVAAYREVLDR